MTRFKKTIAYFISAFMVLFLFNVPALAAVGMNESESNNSASTATVIPSNFDLTQEIGGSIESAGDVDYYKFVPLNSGGYSIETLGTTDTFGYLYDSNMNLLDVSDDQLNPSGINFELRYELTANNTYYIKVTHKNTTGTGNYSLKIAAVNYKNKEIESNDSIQTATLLTDFNTILPAEIGTPGDQDYYKITINCGGEYSIETVGSTDTFGYLYNSDGTPIALDDNSGDENNMKIVYNLSARQSYYVRVSHRSLSGTGSYGLIITPPGSTVSSTDWGADDFSSAKELATNNYLSYSGEGINYSGDVDFYKFTPHVDGIYTFQNPCKCKGRANAYGEVYDSNHTLIKSDANSGPNGNFKVEVQLTANQTYYLKVSAPSGNTGLYSIDIAKGRCLPVPQYLQLPYDELCWATASSMAISYFKNDMINRTVDIAKSHAMSACSAASTLYGPNYYTYPNIFNQPASIFCCGTYISKYVESGISPSTYANGMGDTQENPATHVDNYKCSNNDIIKSIDKGYPIIYIAANHCLLVKGYKEDANGFNIIYNDPMDGQEHLAKTSSDGYVTFYPSNADLEPNNTIASADYVSQYNPVQGSIGNPGDVDFYQFNPTLGTQYIPPSIHYVIETTGTTDTYGELYDSNGNLIASSDNGGQGSNFKIEYNLSTNQTYYIKVRHSGSGTGNYALNLSYIYP